MITLKKKMKDVHVFLINFIHVAIECVINIFFNPDNSVLKIM